MRELSCRPVLLAPRCQPGRHPGHERMARLSARSTEDHYWQRPEHKAAVQPRWIGNPQLVGGATWASAMDAMEGVRSGRARQVVVEMRSVLSPFRRRGMRVVADLDTRAGVYLTGSG